MAKSSSIIAREGLSAERFFAFLRFYSSGRTDFPHATSINLPRIIFLSESFVKKPQSFVDNIE